MNNSDKLTEITPKISRPLQWTAETGTESEERFSCKIFAKKKLEINNCFEVSVNHQKSLDSSLNLLVQIIKKCKINFEYFSS